MGLEEKSYMRICKFCKRRFEKKKGRGQYGYFCSHKCYMKFWKLDPENREKCNQWTKNSKRKFKDKIKKIGCVICGFDRAIDFAHIVSKKDGGKKDRFNTAILCPNHHRLYDRGLLTESEKKKIKSLRFFLAPMSDIILNT